MPAASCPATIRVLPGEIVSRIAAGEVIERPAAVVKELVENSLDAGGRCITVDVKNGGIALIRVTDDGEGMTRADLPLAFERHATSKLRSDGDLSSIKTMGFRGEALPSIASISNVQVVTAIRQEAVGTQLNLDGPKRTIVDAPPVTGTKIEVSDLFYNQPARKKFLKSVLTEFSRIHTVVQQAALAWPSVHFRLTHNGQEILNYPAVASSRDRILQVYRPPFLDKTVELRGRMAGCSVSGVMIDPLHARASKTPQDIFINQRPVRNAAVAHAVTEGYGSFLAKGHHPTYVLFLDIDPEQIDVNVHPAKREIRFADQEAIHRFVRHSVRHAFGAAERKLVLGMGASEEPSSAGPSTLSSNRPEAERTASLHHQGTVDRFTQNAAEELMSDSCETGALFVEEPIASYSASSQLTIIPFGQVLLTYVVAQVGQELHVIDQHTAHERVLFQRLWRAWMKREMVTQPLLIPEPIDLTSSQRMLVEKHVGHLEQLGLYMEPFGTTTMLLRSIPAGLGPLNGSGLIEELLEDLAEWESPASVETLARPILAMLACKSAVQAGRSMTLPEIERLVHDWVEEGLITTCPHGRRTAFRLSADELHKLFGRTGWS
jgi:DNA mismatch repair protein MutL